MWNWAILATHVEVIELFTLQRMFTSHFTNSFLQTDVYLLSYPLFGTASALVVVAV